jgi:predicted RecA/RadA family phage recombinase
MLVGSIFAVATADAANGATVEAETQGVFELTKLSARAWVAGNLIYWDDAAKLMTNVSTSNTTPSRASADRGHERGFCES